MRALARKRHVVRKAVMMVSATNIMMDWERVTRVSCARGGRHHHRQGEIVNAIKVGSEKIVGNDSRRETALILCNSTISAILHTLKYHLDDKQSNY